MTTIALVWAAIRREGEPMLIRRVSTSTAPVLLSCRGVVRGYKPNELIGGLVQGDRSVIISNEEIESQSWPGPPRKGDQVVINGQPSTVQYVNTITLRGGIAKHTLTVRG